jgi:hypothetical protein
MAVRTNEEVEMRRAVLLGFVLIVQCVFVRPTLAFPEHTTVISGSIAAAFCHGHGGGTNCIFCHRDHCHVISCSGGHCTNTVTFRRAGRGTFQRPGGVNSSGGNAPPNGHRHPVMVGGFISPPGIKTTGGNNGAGLIMRHEEHHFGGGHR